MRTPFVLLDWRKSFFQEFLSYMFFVQKDTSIASENMAIIFPHGRAKKYFLYALKESSTIFPYISPQLYTVKEYIATIALATIYKNTMPRTLFLHEEIYLIQDILLSLNIHDSFGRNSFKQMSSKESFMWATSVLPIVKALYTHSSFPKECISETEEGMDPFAHKILFFLKDIYLAYTTILEKEHYTSDAYTLFKVAQYCTMNPSSIETLFPYECTFLAGVAILSGSEDRILQKFWEHSFLDIVLHTDPSLETMPENADRTTVLQKNWIHSWKAKTRCYTSSQVCTHIPKIHLYEAPTIHAELATVASIVQKIGTKETVIIPVDSKLLLPLLHSLSMEDINVSLGYPLENSLFASFLEYAMRAQEKKNEHGYYWKDIVTILQYFSATILNHINNKKDFPILFSVFQEYIRKQNTQYIDIEKLYRKCLSEQHSFSEEAFSLLKNMLEVSCFAFEKTKNLDSIQTCIQGVLDFLCGIGIDLVSPLESEAYRILYTTILPKLSNGIIPNTLLVQENSFYIIREYIAECSLVFEEKPAEALQIVGLLEARLMPFNNIIIVDAIEGALPSIAKENSLIPESMYRKYCSIPDSFQQDILTAYNFFRLLKSANTIHILYRKNVGKGVGDTVSRSRFVEEIIWNWEVAHNEILSIDIENDFLHHIEYTGELPQFLEEDYISKTECIKEAIKNRLEQGISATMLSMYLSCPFKWLQKYIFSIREKNVDSPDTEISTMLLGEAIHYALEHYFTPFIGKYLTKEDFLDKEEEIIAHIYSFFQQKNLLFSIDTEIMLKNTLHKQIRLFLQQQADSFTILDLEKEYTTSIGLIPFFGRIDRVEMRENTLYVMDYKTGKRKGQNPFSTAMKNIFSMLEDKEYSSSQECMDYITKYATQNIQLYLYLYLLAKNTGSIYDSNACFVYLGESPPVEVPLFTEKDMLEDSEYIEEIKTDKLEILFSFLITHMLEHPYIERKKDTKKCEYCPYSSMCI